MRKSILIRIICIAFPLFSIAQQPELQKKQYKLGLCSFHYNSYSQQKTDTRIKIGYPVFQTSTLIFSTSMDLHFRKIKHTFLFESSLPSKIKANNGTDLNPIINTSESNYFRSDFNYRMHLPLIFWNNKIKLNHGVNTGILYEYRKIENLSATSEITRDLNFYLGPQVSGTLFFTSNLKAILSFDANFHLPYFNVGRLKLKDPDNQIYYESKYHGFYYQTNLGLSFAFHRFVLGGFTNNIVGYANTQPNFGTEGIIHHKLDRIYFIKLGYRL